MCSFPHQPIGNLATLVFYGGRPVGPLVDLPSEGPRQATQTLASLAHNTSVLLATSVAKAYQLRFQGRRFFDSGLDETASTHMPKSVSSLAAISCPVLEQVAFSVLPPTLHTTASNKILTFLQHTLLQLILSVHAEQVILGTLGIAILLPRHGFTGRSMPIGHAIFPSIRGRLSRHTGMIWSFDVPENICEATVPL